MSDNVTQLQNDPELVKYVEEFLEQVKANKFDHIVILGTSHGNGVSKPEVYALIPENPSYMLLGLLQTTVSNVSLTLSAQTN